MLAFFKLRLRSRDDSAQSDSARSACPEAWAERSTRVQEQYSLPEGARAGADRDSKRSATLRSGKDSLHVRGSGGPARLLDVYSQFFFRTALAAGVSRPSPPDKPDDGDKSLETYL